MAEEHSIENDAAFNHDDMSVMRILLQSVKGLSPISAAPALEPVAEDSQPTHGQVEFE